jgi:hypothetical protein
VDQQVQERLKHDAANVNAKLPPYQPRSLRRSVPWTHEHHQEEEDDDEERHLSSQLSGCCYNYKAYSASSLCALYGNDCESGKPRATTAATRLVPETASPLLGSVSVSTPPRATPTRTNSATNSPWNTSLIGITSTSCPWTKTDGSWAADTRPLITREKCRTLSVCVCVRLGNRL